MNNSIQEALLRAIRDRLTFVCVALVVVVLFASVPELYKVHVGVRVAAVAIPLAVVCYVRWLRELGAVKPPAAGQASTAP